MGPSAEPCRNQASLSFLPPPALLSHSLRLLLSPGRGPKDLRSIVFPIILSRFLLAHLSLGVLAQTQRSRAEKTWAEKTRMDTRRQTRMCADRRSRAQTDGRRRARWCRRTAELPSALPGSANATKPLALTDRWAPRLHQAQHGNEKVWLITDAAQ